MKPSFTSRYTRCLWTICGHPGATPTSRLLTMPGARACRRNWRHGQAKKAALIVHRDKNTYVVLNRYPYTSGHVMVLPYAHEGSLAALPTTVAHELMDTAQRL